MAQDFPVDAIARALSERWGEWMREGERFSAELDADEKEAWATLSLLDADDAQRLVFEVRTPIGTRGARRSKELALDAADAVVGEYFEDGRPRPTGLQLSREYQGAPMTVKISLERPRLTAEADRLLGESEDGGLDG